MPDDNLTDEQRAEQERKVAEDIALILRAFAAEFADEDDED